MSPKQKRANAMSGATMRIVRLRRVATDRRPAGRARHLRAKETGLRLVAAIVRLPVKAIPCHHAAIVRLPVKAKVPRVGRRSAAPVCAAPGSPVISRWVRALKCSSNSRRWIRRCTRLSPRIWTSNAAPTIFPAAHNVQGDKTKVREELTKLASEHFEIRQKRRELHLKRLEEELKELKASLEKREAQKKEIIERRVSELLGKRDDEDF